MELTIILTALAGALATDGAGEDARGTGLSVAFEGSTRWRYESLSDQFRAGRTGGDQQISGRTLLFAEADAGAVQFGGELIDARVYLADPGSAISTSNVNTLDVLQAYAHVELDEILALPRPVDLRIGRMTIDLGSTRFVGRNGFRNTRNAFTGARFDAGLSPLVSLAGFYVSPVERLPGDRASILDNEHALDEENWDQRFWAVYLERELPALGGAVEAYVYGLHEDEGAQRDLLAPGARLYRSPRPGSWDFEIEHAVQTGQRRSSSSPGAPMLDVSAQTHHSHVGYTFEGPWNLRVAVEYEYASGEEAGDGHWSRWDTLYGLRRTDFGQTGIHGPLRRQNVSAPGVRLMVSNGPIDGRLLVKGAWLASDTDIWRDGGLRDPAGRSGDYIGTHISTRWRYWAVPERLQLETGGAVFAKGAFATDAPNAPDTGDTVYGYLMATVFF
ncbi:hypothetical protein E5163_16260 [Marinicauda algicola]|uniref:Alginate export domain-containing protein n=1 Tax=Marinicauda algicola TaxID=2029849 RepID=A0A4S2GW29_9PROT|nr:hypothetical protein E5163_16260 [Marinicauda algicola]